jgi:hypothetical protein
MWIAYHEHRRVVRLAGVWGLTLRVRRCRNQDCAAYHQAYVPEEAGAWALPQAEFGLDVIAFVGQLRYREQRSVPQIHQALRACGVEIAERSVTVLLHRYEELVALRLGDATRLRERLAAQGGVILAIDGLQPDVGHEVLWVLRDVRSGEVLLARSLLSASEDDLAPLLEEAREALSAGSGDTSPLPTIPILGVVSDGQHSIRRAVARALPEIPHQLCQFHYLRVPARRCAAPATLRPRLPPRAQARPHDRRSGRGRDHRRATTRGGAAVSATGGCGVRIGRRELQVDLCVTGKAWMTRRTLLVKYGSTRIAFLYWRRLSQLEKTHLAYDATGVATGVATGARLPHMRPD